MANLLWQEITESVPPPQPPLTKKRRARGKDFHCDACAKYFKNWPKTSKEMAVWSTEEWHCYVIGRLTAASDPDVGPCSSDIKQLLLRERENARKELIARQLEAQQQALRRIAREGIT